MSNQAIKCPNCKHEFDVSNVLTKTIEEKYLTKYQSDIANFENTLRKKEEELKSREQQFSSKLEEELNLAKKNQEETLRLELQNKMKSYFDEQKIKMDQLIAENKDLKLKDLEIEDLKRKNENQRLEIEIQFQKKLSEELKEERKRLETLTKEKFDIQFREEKEKQILKDKENEEKNRQLMEQIQSLNRKLEQGSMQAQGEAQELVIQETLKKMFPTDLIEEVEKGVRGADCVQTIFNKFGKNCGKILYESKRTKNWSEEWIDKLKKDNASIKADVLVIISETLPNNVDRIQLKDNVWVCSYMDYKIAVALIRHQLLQVFDVTEQNSNKGDKMRMLYDFFQSIEFKSQFQAILGGYEKLQRTYADEKKLMHRIWSQREKEMDHILINAHEFLGSLQGIAGGNFHDIALPTIDEKNLLEGL